MLKSWAHLCVRTVMQKEVTTRAMAMNTAEYALQKALSIVPNAKMVGMIANTVITE